MTKQKVDHKKAGRMICAWCGEDMGPSNTDEDSHGICKECAESVFRKDRACDKRKKGAQ